MPISFEVVGEPGMDLYCTLQQVTSAGALGNIWNNDSLVWAANPATNLREIPLTQGTSTQANSWTGGVSTSLGGVTSMVLVRIHDRNQSSAVVAARKVSIVSGNEAPGATQADVLSVPFATYSEITSQGGVPSTNVSTMTTAVNNAKTAADNALAEATLAKTEATAAKNAANAAQVSAASADGRALNAQVAAASADGKLPSDTATKINRLDATISSRSSHAPADIVTYANTNGGILSSNMRGTDNAFLAASWVAPANSTITTAASDIAQVKTDVTTLVSTRLTATRAGYLDNLSAGPVATQSSVNSIQNTVRSRFIGPTEFAIPSSGSSPVLLSLALYNANGTLNSADSLPVVTAKNAAGTDRSANLGAVSNPATGRYEVTYTVASTHLNELITVTATWAEASQPSLDVLTMYVSTSVSGGGGGGSGTFDTGDRTKLEAIYNKLPSKPYLTGTAASDGDINLDELTGDKTAFGPSNAGLATSAEISALPANVRTYLNSNPVPASNMRGTDSALLAANYTAPDNAGISSTLSQATTAATQATGANTQATSAANTALAINGKLPADTSTKIDRLDAAISTRSTFNPATTSVSIASGHGLSLESTSQSIKAKTDLITGTLATTANIPNVGEITSGVVAGILTAQPGTWAAGGDATQAKQDQILTQISAITPTPVSPVLVNAARTWQLRVMGASGYKAPNHVTVSSASTSTIAMSFDKALNPEASITTVAEVVVLAGDALSPTNLKASGDRREAHFTLASPTAGERDVRVKVNTSDGEVLSGVGRLVVV